MTTPFRVAAAIQGKGVFQMNSARARVIRKASGMALVAGQRNPTMRMKMATMGREARRARMATDIDRVLKAASKYPKNSNKFRLR
jgi:hypothetical protein